MEIDRLDAWVTGATGLLGRWLVPELTRDGRRVGVLVRGARARAAEYLAWVDAHGGRSDRVALLEGDLRAEGLGLDASDAARAVSATEVFHLGAAMAFGMRRSDAQAVNEGGTRRVFELAARGSRLRRVVMVSGFRIAHAPSDPAHLARLGAYEASKVAADRWARAFARAQGLPLTLIHPAAVIGDSRTGETTQTWGFAQTIEQLAEGRMLAVPGGARHWLPLVTVDHVARFTAGVAALPSAAGAEFFLLDDRTPPIGALVAQIARQLGRRPPRLRAPTWLLSAVLRAGLDRVTGVSAESLSFIAEDRYDLAPTRAAESALGLVEPDFDLALERYVAYLVATRFGRAAVTAERAEPVPHPIG